MILRRREGCLTEPWREESTHEAATFTRQRPDPCAFASFGDRRMKILLIRLMGLGDVASILVPAVTIHKQRYPDAAITALTYQAGGEIMALHPDVDDVICLSKAEWPDDLLPAVTQFMQLGESIAAKRFDLIVNLDTWFMPCFLARALRDAGIDARGNYLNQSIEDFMKKAISAEISQGFFDKPGNYMASTFPNMSQWTIPWWEQHPDTGYPDFYLRACCGFSEPLQMQLPCAPDAKLLQEANGRPVVALSMQGRADYKNYRHRGQLAEQLETRGVYCWSQFDGSVPMQTTLNRLSATQLLVTVPTSTQWLGRLAGCPSLILPGPMSPTLLDAEFWPPQRTNCQYCYRESHCPENRNFECMETAPEALAEQILDIVKSS